MLEELSNISAYQNGLLEVCDVLDSLNDFGIRVHDHQLFNMEVRRWERLADYNQPPAIC